MVKRSVALVLLCVGALFAMSVSIAQADTGEIVQPQNNPPTAADGWQAATCTTDEPAAGKHCSPENPSFFTQAGGHPPIGFTQYTIAHEESTGALTPSGIPIATEPLK